MRNTTDTLREKLDKAMTQALAEALESENIRRKATHTRILQLIEERDNARKEVEDWKASAEALRKLQVDVARKHATLQQTAEFLRADNDRLRKELDDAKLSRRSMEIAQTFRNDAPVPSKPAVYIQENGTMVLNAVSPPIPAKSLSVDGVKYQYAVTVGRYNIYLEETK